MIAFLLIEAGGVGLVVVEGTNHHPHLTIVDGFWWAMTTVTTIGYGDIAPLTNGGRLIAMCVMVVGLGFVAIATGAAAQYFINRQGGAQAASTNEILAAVQEVKVQLHAVSERLDRLETTRGGPHRRDVGQRWTASSSTTPTIPATDPRAAHRSANEHESDQDHACNQEARDVEPEQEAHRSDPISTGIGLNRASEQTFVYEGKAAAVCRNRYWAERESTAAVSAGGAPTSSPSGCLSPRVGRAIRRPAQGAP